jgi:hypothetical protein
MSFPYRTVRGNNGVTTVQAFNYEVEEPFYSTTSNNPAFEQIIAGLKAEDPNVWSLFKMGAGISAKFREITDRVSYDGTQILFDGDPEHDALAQQILRALETGEQDFTALARFREGLASNPVPHSRAQAYDWLATHDFKVTQEGDIVAYKGVRKIGEDTYTSTATSTVAGKPSGYVNGVAQPERSVITQRIGDVVSMPRSEVVHDPTQSCSRGLHVGTYNYASMYGNAILEVHVNARDFVSVPTGEGEKGRVCRYKVIAERFAEHGGRSPVLSGAGVAWGDVGYEPR